MWICPKCGRAFKRTGQGHYCGKPPETVEEYIGLQEETARPCLSALREAVRHSVEDVNECILWSMPTYKTEKDTISFAACKEHVSFYVGEEAIGAFRDRLGQYKTRKAAIYLPYGKELPTELIGDIAKWCLTL